MIGDIGAYSIYPWTAALEPVQVVSFLPGPYRIEHYRGRVRGVVTSKAPTGPYRGVGRPISTFAMERLIDMAAVKLGLDAKDIRLRNLVASAEFPYKAASGIVWDQSGFQECLNIACDTIGYDALRAKQAAARKEGRWYGIGIASYAELTGIGSRIPVAPGMPINTGTETADIRIEADGRVTAAFGIASHGQGLETTLAQVIAEHLGARIEDICVVHGDTAVANGGTGTYASRSMVLAGGAATLASQAVRDKVLNAASYLLETATADLIAEGGRITVAGTDRFVTFAEVANAVHTQDALPAAAQGDLAATMTYDPIFGTTTAATHIAAVEIDIQTFQVRIDGFAVAEDCGKLVNPLIVDGQVHGGVAQGVGAALFEEVMYDAQGQIMTASLVDYLVPSSMEIPPMQVAHLESASPTTLGRLPRDGRRRHNRRASGDRQRHCRRIVAARHRDQRIAGNAGAPVSFDRDGVDENQIGCNKQKSFKEETIMDLGLKGKTALITGAASGVGREIALTLAAEGAAVALNYRSSADEAQALASEIKAKGGNAKAYQADVADFAAVKAMTDAVVKDFGGLNILINNAGLAKRQRFVETTPDDWHRQIDASLYGAIHCCHAAAPHLEAAQNGRIVSVIGDSSRVGESGLSIVAAARAGVVALMKSLAREFGRSGTTANTVSLGLVETAHDKDWVDANREKLIKLYPVRRLGLPGDIAPMVALLSSPHSGWITGQVLSISGGFSMV